MERLIPVFLAACVAAAVLLCFWPAPGVEFLNWLDDEELIDNTHWRGLDGSHLARIWAYHHVHYVPIAWMSYALDYEIGGLNPWGYRLTNVVLHAIVAALFLVLVRELLPGDGLRREAAAFTAALLFALHPLRVESVAWISSRRDVLSGVFFLATLLAYVKMARGGSRRRFLPLALAFFALALLSKAWVMGLPLVLLMMDACPLGRFGREPVRVLLLEKLPFLAMSVAMAAVAFLTLSHVISSVEAYGPLPRILQACYNACFHPLRTLWPAELSPLYPLSTQPALTDPRFSMGLAIAVVVTAVLLTQWRRRPWAPVAWGCYLVLIAPTSGLSQAGLHLVADRYSYLSTMSFALLAAAGLMRLRPAAFGGVSIALLGVSALWAGQTSRLAHGWDDSVALWSRAIRVDPTNTIAHVKLAFAHEARGEDEKAFAHYDAALNLNPNHPLIHLHLGEFHLNRDRPKEALAQFEKALALNPRQAQALNDRAAAHHMMGMLPEAERDYLAAADLDPRYEKPWIGLARLSEAAGKPAVAAEAYAEAIRRRPDAVKPHRLRGDVLMGLRRWGEAAAEFSAAIDLSPGDRDTHIARGFARFHGSDPEGAKADFIRASEIDPDPALPFYLRGMLARSAGNREAALADLQEASKRARTGSETHGRIRQLLDELQGGTP